MSTNESAEQQARDMLVRMGYPSARYASAGSVVELANLINNMSRFKVDVAYMQVPRCDSCKHWDKDVSEKDQGTCLKVYGHDDTKMWPDMYDGITTMADFGCTQWEAK